MSRSLRSPRSTRSRALLALLLLIFCAAGCGRPPRESPPNLSSLPQFELLERSGETVTRESLLGRPWIADFVFTRCPAACPRLTAKMKDLGGRLPASSGARMVSISVDPEFDRPAVLAAYAERWQVRNPRWMFVTGERDAVWTLIREGFLLPVEAQDDVANPILHSNRFALVDAAGNLRGTYEAFDPEALDRLLLDLAVIEGEARR